MPCSICLDDFEQNADHQPAALTCGHIFHFKCITDWFYGSGAAVNIRQTRCPLCAVSTKPASVLKLFPSDFDDLTKYLAAQQHVDPESSSSATRSHEASQTLLCSLMDLNQSLQAYVMAVHMVRVDTMTKSGTKIKQLIHDTTPSSITDKKAEFDRAIDALHRVARHYDDQKNHIQRTKKKLKDQEAKAKQIEERANTKLQKAEAASRRAAKLDEEVRTKMQAVEQGQARCRQVEQDLDRRSTDLDTREASLATSARDLDAERRKLHLETTMKISSIEQKTRNQIDTMKEQVEQALRKCGEAEREKDAVKQKNNAMAAQMRELKDQVRELKEKYRTQKAAASSTPVASSTAPELMESKLKRQDVEIQMLKRQMSRLQTSIDQRSSNANNGTRRSTYVDLTQSSSPSATSVSGPSSPVTPLNKIDAPNRALDLDALTNSSRNSSQRPHKKGRTHLYIESENLDDEMDEDLFPMPGVHSTRTLSSVGAFRNAAKAVNGNGKGNKGSSSISDNAQRHAGSGPAKTLPWLNATSGLVLGPKARPKS